MELIDANKVVEKLKKESFIPYEWIGTSEIRVVKMEDILKIIKEEIRQ